MEAVDLLPTLCDLAGVRVPWQMQGRSIAPALLGEEDAGAREDVLAMHGGPGRALYAMLRTVGMKYIRYGAGAEVLYDLQEEPGEYTNRATDAAYAERLWEMRERLLGRMLHAAGGGLAAHRPF